MTPFRRHGFSAYDCLVVLAVLGVLSALLLMAVVKARLNATRAYSTNNLKQILLAAHGYHDTNLHFPAGNDDNNFSALARLLPYLEQNAVAQQIDFDKPVDDNTNDKARGAIIRTFVSPLDPQQAVRDGVGATSYLMCAGSKPALIGNNGVFCQDSKVTLGAITNANGTSTTMAAAETLKGDGGTKAADVRRQHVVLKPPEKPKEPKVDAEHVKRMIADLASAQFEARRKATDELEKLGEAIEPALKKALDSKPALDVSKRIEGLLQKVATTIAERTTIKDDAGAADWQAGTNIAGNRGASWMDGRFLQTTFSANRLVNDARPDVSISGLGGLSSMRSLAQTIQTAFCDGHIQNLHVIYLTHAATTRNWQNMANWQNTEPVQLP